MLGDKELNEIGFYKYSAKSYLSVGMELEYIPTTKELYNINDGLGEPEFLTKTIDIDFLEFMFFKYEGFYYNG